MAYISSHILKHCLHSQSCRRGVLLGLLLYLIHPVLSHSPVVATAKGQAEQTESAVNAIYLPFICHNATLTGLPPTPALTPIATALPTDTFPSSSILPTITPTLSTPLPAIFTPTVTPALVDTPVSTATPTPIPTDGTIVPTTPVATLTPITISTTVTTPTPTATPVKTLLPTAMPTATATPTTPTPTPGDPAPPTTTATSDGNGTTMIYISSNGDGTIGGIAFHDEDILSYNMTTGVWAMVFDGSDVGVTGDVEALHVESDGSLLLSFESTTHIPGFGAVEDEDIVRFIPTSLGETTTGSFAWFFDGSDVGLDTDDEDIDALTRLPDGRLVISTAGDFNAGGVSGLNQDLFVFTASSLGETTSGTWAIYFDGSDVGLTHISEDIWGVDVAANGNIYLSTNYTYAVPGLSGDSNDIFICTPTSLGDNTSCTFSLYWDGDNYGFSNYWLDVLAVSDVTLVGRAATERTAVETEVARNQIYLPIINR